jgi:hypothetical protein
LTFTVDAEVAAVLQGWRQRRPAGRRLQYGSTTGSSVALAPMRAAAVLAF